MHRVLEREDRIDYLVIETTGIADPLPIVLTFVGSELRDLTHLDSILTVVDAETFTPDHFESQAAMSQITYGDIILLNKTDLAEQPKVIALEEWIRSIKTGARMIQSQYGKVPLPLILGVGYFEAEAHAETQVETHDHHHHHPDHDDHHHHSDHLANDGFVSMSYQSDRPFSVHKFQCFLDELPIEIFRAKGLIWFKESDLKHIFQLSGKRYEIQTEEWQHPCSNQLVLIGRNLNTEQLRQQLDQCLEPAPSKRVAQ